MGSIFIEGLPCSGKSTLVKALAAAGTSVQYELGKILPREAFPGNGQTVQEVAEIDRWFIRQEGLRRPIATTTVFDRSYFTHLCYAFAYSRLTGLQTAHQTVMSYREALLAGNLFLPDGLVIVHVEPEVSVQRQLKKLRDGVSRGLPGFWRTIEFLSDFNAAYRWLVASMNGIPVITIDGNLDPERKLAVFQQWTGELSKCPQPTLNFPLFLEHMEYEK